MLAGYEIAFHQKKIFSLNKTTNPLFFIWPFGEFKRKIGNIEAEDRPIKTFRVTWNKEEMKRWSPNLAMAEVSMGKPVKEVAKLLNSLPKWTPKERPNFSKESLDSK